MLTRCGSCHSRAHFHTLFAGLNADCVFPELSARARVPQRCWAYRSARQLSGALSRKLTWLTQTISRDFIYRSVVTGDFTTYLVHQTVRSMSYLFFSGPQKQIAPREARD